MRKTTIMTLGRLRRLLRRRPGGYCNGHYDDGCYDYNDEEHGNHVYYYDDNEYDCGTDINHGDCIDHCDDINCDCCGCYDNDGGGGNGDDDRSDNNGGIDDYDERDDRLP